MRSLTLALLATLLLGCPERKTPALRPTASPVAPPAPEPRTRLTVLTYNVLATPLHAEHRTPPLLALLERSGADIIALQEVAPWFLRRLRGAPWSRRYHFSRVGQHVAPGGQLILSRLPIRRTIARVHPGPQRRVAVMAVIDLGGKRELAVATTHMESYLEDGPMRAKQLDQIFALLRPHRHAMLLGDLNFGDAEQPETAHLDKRYRDVWSALKGTAPGFTWNRERSPMAHRGSFKGEKSRRLDRILIRSDALSPKTVRIIGDRPVSAAHPEVFPSDHFGLVATLTVALP